MRPPSPELIASVATGAAVAIGLWPATRLLSRFAGTWCRDGLASADALGMDRRPIEAWLACWGPSIIAAVVVIGGLLRSPLLALPVVALLVAAPRVALGIAVESRRKEFRRQLIPAMSGLANTTRAGMPVTEGLATVARELQQPLRGEFETIVAENRAGRPLARVLGDVKKRLGLEPFTLFATALQVQIERGGSATDLLDVLSENLRDLERLERTMDAATAGNRTSIFVLSMFPVFFFLAMFLLLPRETTMMFTTLPGQFMLMTAILLTWGSIAWSRSLLNFRR